MRPQDGNGEHAEPPSVSEEPAATASAAAAHSTSGNKAERRRAALWPGKASVIDQLNELVGELRDLESNIALHVRHLRALQYLT